jgi:hypothetical protein
MRERRLFPRYAFAYPVWIRGGEGGPFKTETSEVSLGGVGVQLHRAAVVALAQGGSILTPGDCLDVALSPVMQGGDPLWLKGRALHVRRLSLDRYMVGIAFEGATEEEEAALADVVAQAGAERPGH